MRRFLLHILVLLPAGCGVSVSASDSAQYSVQIATGSFSGGKLLDTVDVILEAHGDQYAALDMKVASGGPNIEITEVLKGEICDSCGWEFFNAKKLGDIEELGLRSVWQIVALAEMMPDSIVPTCYGWDQPGSIARLVISRAHEPVSMEVVDSICFVWQDCSDNSISGKSGVVLAIAELPTVEGFSGTVPMSLEFPNTISASGSCIKPDKKDRVKRLIEFSRGRVRYEADSLGN